MNLYLSTYKIWIVASCKCFSTDGDPISVLSVRVKIFKLTGYKYSPEKFQNFYEKSLCLDTLIVSANNIFFNIV